MKHLQQFLGCTNWLRPHLTVEYVHAVKVLSPYMREGAVFPPEGLGPGTTDADKAVRAIKHMARRMIRLAVLDEAAALSGERPLEQVADSSGIAWGGTCLQMCADLTKFNVLLTAGKGLTPPQQSWHPLTLERVCAAGDEACTETGAGKPSFDMLDGSRQLDQADGSGGY